MSDDYAELPRKHPDAPRRFRVDCRTCQGAGAECRDCGGKGTQIVEVDPDKADDQ